MTPAGGARTSKCTPLVGATIGSTGRDRSRPATPRSRRPATEPSWTRGSGGLFSTRAFRRRLSTRSSLRPIRRRLSTRSSLRPIRRRLNTRSLLPTRRSLSARRLPCRTMDRRSRLPLPAPRLLRLILLPRPLRASDGREPTKKLRRLSRARDTRAVVDLPRVGELSRVTVRAWAILLGWVLVLAPGSAHSRSAPGLSEGAKAVWDAWAEFSSAARGLEERADELRPLLLERKKLWKTSFEAVRAGDNRWKELQAEAREYERRLGEQSDGLILLTTEPLLTDADELSKGAITTAVGALLKRENPASCLSPDSPIKRPGRACDEYIKSKCRSVRLRDGALPGSA